MGGGRPAKNIAPEDHYASGGKQQEQKKALKKSVKEKQSQPPPGQSAGQHSTGSFTGTTGGQSPQTTGGPEKKR